MTMNSFNLFIFLVSLLSIHHCNGVSENHLKIEIKRNGKDATLSCLRLEDNNKQSETLTIEWVGPTGASLGNEPTLYLKNVQQKDLGTYTCRGYIYRNYNVIRTEVAAPLIVGSTQIFEDIDEFKNLQVLNLWEGQSLNVICESGENNRKISWRRSDGLEITGNNHLYIDSVVQNKDQGKYFCMIGDDNKLTASILKTVIVNITVPSLKVEVMPTESIKLFGMIHRRCLGLEFVSPVEKFKFKWLNSNNLIVSESRMLQLPINELSMLGEYQCMAENILEGIVYKTKTYIYSTVVSDRSVEEYKISIASHPAQFKFNEDLSLQCQVFPENKKFDFYWYKNNEYVGSGKVFHVNKFHHNNTGNYKCVALGITENSKQINLEAVSYQRICNFQHYQIELTCGGGQQILVNQGQYKELHCEINAGSNHTGMDVQWKFNDQFLTKKSFRKFKLSRFDGKMTSILIIQETKITNEGRYKCVVGGSEKSVSVAVVPETGFVYVHPQKLEVTKGDSVEFHCRIDGIPNINNNHLTWTFVSKNGTKVDLKKSNWKVNNPTSASLTSFITSENATMNDNGYFICTAPNGAESRGLLIVRELKRNVKVTVTPSTISVHANQRFEFECYGGDVFGHFAGVPTVRFLNGSDVKSDPRFTVIQTGESRIRVIAPSGVKISEKDLNITCGIYGVTETINIRVQVICPQGQRSCTNGKCINSSSFCNKIVDCEDGSDEEESNCNICDPVVLPCGKVSSIYNSTLQGFNINWRCDGENDCKNGFDERDCPVPNKNCNTQRFTCNDKTVIPYGNVCDKSADCSEGEDEAGCEKPQIISTSENQISATIGTTVTMICEAAGYPLPKIAWRYNWGCLLETNRISVTETIKNCSKVISVLQIKNFQSGDDAIYGCEAISQKSRAFGKDFFVTISA